MLVVTAEDRKRMVLMEQARRRERYDLGAFIPRLTPAFVNPRHMCKVCNVFDRIARGESVFALIEAPPRHSKSETVFHGFARELRYRPTTRIAYASYSNLFAFRKSRRVRSLAAQAGARVGEQKSSGDLFQTAAAVSYWETSEGGQFIAGGRGGGFKGEGFNIVGIDDPYKNRAEYESKVIREVVWDMYTGTLRDRVEPGGSMLIFHQRWGDDDLIARIKDQALTKKFGTPWDVISLPAVSNAVERNNIIVKGDPLWPERYDLDALNGLREDVGEYNWWSQFQQKPRPRGDRVFGEAARFRYEDFETMGKVPIISVDSANTVNPNSDRTAIMVSYWWTARTGIDGASQLWGAAYQGWQIKRETPELVDFLRRLQMHYKGAPLVIEATGDGRATGQTLRRADPKLQVHLVSATNDKYTNAIPISGLWNRQRFLVPETERKNEKPWIKDWMKVVTSFTGVADKIDDAVDCMSGACNFAASSMGGGRGTPKKGKRREMTDGF